MMTALKDEIRVLHKYASGGYINHNEDGRTLERLVSLGLVRRGLDFKTMKETAKSTTLGKKILRDLK